MRHQKIKLLSLVFLCMGSLYGDALAPPCVVQKVKAGDIEMAYYTRGTGKPLVMIMGFKGTMAMWDPALLVALQKKYQLILFDNRGAGLSSDTDVNETTIEQMADDTANLIQALGFKKVSVLGWSMGSRIAQQLAIRHPDLVEKMVLCAPNAGGTTQVKTEASVLKQLNQPNLPEKHKLAMIFPETEAGKLAAKNYMQRLTDGLKDQTIPNDFAVSTEAIMRQSNARGPLWVSSEDNYNALPSLSVPTLVAEGVDDVVNPSENAKIVASRIPFSWLTYFPGGHAFLFQNYKSFSDLVTLFLEEK